MAIPATSPGSMSGETMNVASAFQPGNRVRTIASAHRVPSTRETKVDSNAICAENARDSQKLSSRSRLRYQRSDTPVGGKSKTGDGVTETPITIMMGAIRYTTAKTAAAMTSG